MSDLLVKLRIEADGSSVRVKSAEVKRELDGLKDAVLRTDAAMGAGERQARRYAAGLDQAGDQAQRFEARTRGLAGGVSLLGGALGGLAISAFARDISQAAFAAAGLETGLTSVAGGAAGARAELAFVAAEADRLGFVVQKASKEFMGFAAATNGTALAGEATREVWLATAEAGMALGRSNEEISRAFTALSQIAGKGVVSMEEVRQQLAEAIPGSAAIGARALNLTTAEFNALVESGELTAERFLPAFAAQLRTEFGPAIEDYLNSPLGRARQEIGRFETRLETLRAAAGGEFLEGLAEGLLDVNAALGDDQALEAARELGEAIGEAAAAAARALGFVVDNIDGVVAAGRALIALALGKVLAEAAAGAQLMAARQLQLAASTRAAELAKAEGALVAARAQLAAANAVATEARQTLAATAAGVAYVDAKIAATRANTALIAAENAVAAAAGRVAAAQGAATASTTAMGGAATLARSAAGGLLALMGGPWGLALAGAAMAAWAVSDALAAQEQQLEQITAAHDAYGDAMAEAESVLREAGLASAAFGDESAGAVAGTDSLTSATARLTDQTYALADARAEASRQGLLAAREQVLEQRRQVQAAVDRNALLTTPGLTQIFGSDEAREQARRRAAESTRVRVQTGETDTGEPIFGRISAADALESYTRQAAELNLRAQQLGLIELGADDGARPPAESSSAGSIGSGRRNGRDRSAELLADLTAERAATEAHTRAVIEGEAALDAWRIAQAGVDAVLRSGLETGSAFAEQIRGQAEAVERLAIQNERIADAAGFTRRAEEDTRALQRRAQAAGQGREALEALRIEEARLTPLLEARVQSLDELSGPERAEVERAMAAAEARERQAIATERAEAAGASVEDLERQIAAEGRRQAAIGQGVLAEQAYARAEFIRQEIERAGLEVTDAQSEAIREKAAALFDLQVVTDAAQRAADQERELRLLRLTAREREIAVRAERELVELQALKRDLTEEELAFVAEKRARAELEREETAAAIGRITGSLRDGFIRDGKLGLDELADYAEERLRAALYDAFLAEPIRIVVEATVDIVNDLARQIFGGKDAQGFLGGLLGRFGLNGRAVGNAGIGMAAGQALGQGSGNGLMDLGLSLGGQALGSWAGGAVASAVGGSLGGALGSVMGPLGALAGMALGELLKDEKRPYTRADIVAQGGQFVVAGTDTADGGDGKLAAELGKAVSESLNAAASLFGIDVKALEGLYTTAGYVAGGNFKALGGEGFFGGDIRGGIDFYNQAGRDKKGNTLGAGVSFSQIGSAEDLAEEVVRETILRAIAAGASDLTAAEAALVKSARSLEEAIAVIEAGRDFTVELDDMLEQLIDPAAFERRKAIEAVEETYRAMKAEAERLIEAGLISADVLEKLERLRDLQMDAALRDLEGDIGGLGGAFASARDRILSFLDGLEVSELAPGGPIEQRDAALAQYERLLAMAQLGDERALNDITTYAERLLRADREATGSAADRTALFERVTADLRALAEQTQPLTAAAIAGPIVDALAGSQTALAQILLSLPTETAAPLLNAILREPDWATRLVSENVQVPPALEALRGQVLALAPETALPIVAAVLATPEWANAANAQLALVPPSLAAMTTALNGLAGATTAPVIAALLATPAWADLTVAYLQNLPPSFELLASLLEGQPASIADPIVAALRETPGWAMALLAWLSDQASAPPPTSPGQPAAPATPPARDPLTLLDGLAGLTPGRGRGDRPYSRADIVAMGGQWTVAGLDAADGGDRAAAEALGRTISESLNAASAMFGLNLAAVEGLYTTAGFVTGGNYKALGGEGFFGGDIRGDIDLFGQAGRDKKGNTLGAGVSFSQFGSAEALAEQVVWETLRRAIDAGASTLSADVLGQVRSAPDLSAALQAVNARATIDVPLARVDRLEAPRTDVAVTELVRLREAIEAGLNGLSNAMSDQLGDLTAATASGLEDLRGASADQVEHLRDLASAQRVANAQLLARAF